MLPVSVVIPTCDRADYLRDALASVAAQTVVPAEIIVADNGTTPVDRSLIPTHVAVIDLPSRCGPSRARNAGAKAARHPLIAFLDDDDLWAPDYLDRLVAAIDTGADCAIAERTRFYPDGTERAYANPLPSRVPSPTDRNFYKAPGFGGTNFLIRRDRFLAVGGFDPALSIAEDQDLFTRLARDGTRFALVPTAICRVRQHHGPRLRDKVLSGTWTYYRKHSRDLTFAQHVHFAKRLANAVKKTVRTPIRAAKARRRARLARSTPRC